MDSVKLFKNQHLLQNPTGPVKKKQKRPLQQKGGNGIGPRPKQAK